MNNFTFEKSSPVTKIYALFAKSQQFTSEPSDMAGHMLIKYKLINFIVKNYKKNLKK